VGFFLSPLLTNLLESPEMFQLPSFCTAKESIKAIEICSSGTKMKFRTLGINKKSWKYSTR